MPTTTVHTIKPDDRLGARLRSVSQGGSVAVTLVGGVVLLGWMLDVTSLKSLGQGALVVKANTAIGFLLAGASLCLALSPRTGRHRRRLALAGAVLVALIGLATLSQDLFGWDLGIDQLLFTEMEGAPGTASPGRMAPNTALMFVLTGLGLSLLNQTTIRGPGPCQFLTLAAGTIALSGVLGHTFGESGFYGLRDFSSMALPTALTTVVLCLSMLFARPASGLMAFVTDRGAVGVLVRRLLPVAFLVPPAFGWLGLWGERNALYTSAFGAVLVTMANMAALALIAWATVRALTREHLERARVAAALVKSERLQNAIFNSVNFSSIATDAKGVIQVFNVGAERMLGYAAADVVNTITPADISDPQELVARARTLSLELGTPIAPGFEALAFKAARGIEDIYELTYIRKGGGRIPAVVSVTALRDDQDAIIGYLLIGTDNTARKQVDDERLKLEQQLQQKNTELEDAGRTLEAQFRQANKMDAIGQLAAGVAHDFNNLLTVILGFSELITADASLPRHHLNDLQEITKAARRASGLTNQLLAFSRQQALSAIPLDVNALVTEMSGMLGRLIGDHITITVELAPALPLVLADRGQLEQVVMNLVVNARDAMPGGGRVTIRTASVALESSVLDEDTIAAGAYVRLSVTDTGIGMSQDTQAHLFEPFFTTKGVGKGTGLGLSTVAGIIRQSHGHITVDSELGKGTAFIVFLPSSDRPVAGAPDPVVDEAPGTRPPATVLVVDDDEGVRRLATRVLTAAGYRVLEAVSGTAAETLFAQQAGAVDLLVTDVIMPGCSGPELVKRLRAHAPALPVVFMSGYLSEQQRAAVDPLLPFVQKPFTAMEFSRRIAEALQAARPI